MMRKSSSPSSIFFLFCEAINEVLQLTKEIKKISSSYLYYEKGCIQQINMIETRFPFEKQSHGRQTKASQETLEGHYFLESFLNGLANYPFTSESYVF